MTAKKKDPVDFDLGKALADSKASGREPVIDKPMENLIEQAKAKNAALAVQNQTREVQQNAIPSDKLRQIESILKDGGMDSMSVSKAMDKIRTILA